MGLKKALAGLCILLCCLFAPSMVSGQSIVSMVQNLKPEQKKQLLQTLQSMSNDLDTQLQCAFENLKPADKTKAVQLIQSMESQAEGKTARTEVSWSRDTLNFGEVEEGKIVLDSVLLVNTGDKPYIVTEVKSSCDCAVNSDPIVLLMPGDITTVRVQLNTYGKKGKVQGALVFFDNSAPNARSIIYIKGIVRPVKTAKKRPWE
jgi:Protein of unknown function (DUF1573)